MDFLDFLQYKKVVFKRKSALSFGLWSQGNKTTKRLEVEWRTLIRQFAMYLTKKINLITMELLMKCS
jgi:hypothetical protein